MNKLISIILTAVLSLTFTFQSAFALVEIDLTDTDSVTLSNRGASDEADLTFYAASYDDNGKLLDVYLEHIQKILKGADYKFYPTGLTERIKLNYNTKLFVWSDTLCPTSEVISCYGLITRLEIAKMFVELYETDTGAEIEITEDFSFKDTDEPAPHKLHQLQIVGGYQDGTFNPDGSISNGEIVMLLSKVLAKLGYIFNIDESFTSQYEVDEDHFSYTSLIQIESTGILYDIYPEFNPDENCTIKQAEELIDACYRLLGHETITRLEIANLLVDMYETEIGEEVEIPEASPFSDTDEIAPRKLHKLGIVKGNQNGTFNPQGDITNGQAVMLLTLMIAALDYDFDVPYDTELNPDDKCTVKYAKALIADCVELFN